MYIVSYVCCFFLLIFSPHCSVIDGYKIYRDIIELCGVHGIRKPHKCIKFVSISSME